MKTQIEDYGYVAIQFSARNIASLITKFYHEDDKEVEIMFKALTKDFNQLSVGLRQDLLKNLIKQHFSKATAKKVIELVDSFDSEMFD